MKNIGKFAHLMLAQDLLEENHLWYKLLDLRHEGIESDVHKVLLKDPRFKEEANELILNLVYPSSVQGGCETYKSYRQLWKQIERQTKALKAEFDCYMENKPYHGEEVTTKVIQPVRYYGDVLTASKGCVSPTVTKVILGEIYNPENSSDQAHTLYVLASHSIRSVLRNAYEEFQLRVEVHNQYLRDCRNLRSSADEKAYFQVYTRYAEGGSSTEKLCVTWREALSYTVNTELSRTWIEEISEEVYNSDR